MSEWDGGGVGLLTRAVDVLLDERPVELPETVALARCTALIVARERLDAATLAAVGDVDRRELFTLDAAGSTRGWLRRQLGGDGGQLVQARRLRDHDQVFQAQALGELSGRGAGQLCSALEQVPDTVDEAVLEAVLVDGVQELLGRQLGRGLPEHVLPSAAQLALRAELASTVGDALADDLSTPVARLTPALLLLARGFAPGILGWALGRLLDALLPESITPPDDRLHYLELLPMLDGDWDLRGHLDHETGTLLRDEIARRERARQSAEAAALRDGLAEAAARGDVIEVDPFGREVIGRPAPIGSRGRQRHDDLRQLLRDCADVDACSGKAAPVAITIVASLDAVEGRAGALPGMLLTEGKPVSITAEMLQRSGCHSELNAVLLDAAGRPVGASSTRRSASSRERAALLAVWGPFCAGKGCFSTDTVPHHVNPWWLGKQTVLKDLVPFCKREHMDVHDHHRTIELEDGRRLDEFGWVVDER